MAASGANPSDVKERQDAFGYGMPYPRVVPHSDAAGEGVSQEWVGRRVWCHGAQTYRPFGAAAEHTTVPPAQAVPLPDIDVGVLTQGGSIATYVTDVFTPEIPFWQLPPVTHQRTTAGPKWRHLKGDLCCFRIMISGA